MGAGLSHKTLVSALRATPAGDVQEMFQELSAEDRERLSAALSELMAKDRQARILITGGDSGAGPALCKLFASELGCRVFMGARDKGRGEEAVKDFVEQDPGCEGLIEVVRLDAKSTSSVLAAAKAVKSALGQNSLHAIVNNAHVAQSHGLTAQAMVSTNLFLCEAFIPLLDADCGRLINLGSRASPWFAKSCDSDRKQIMTTTDTTWEQVEAAVEAELTNDPLIAKSALGVSKACLAVYSRILAGAYPRVQVSSVPASALDLALAPSSRAPGSKPQDCVTSVFEPLIGSVEGACERYDKTGLQTQRPEKL